ncbi:MAG: NAD(P)H-dependent oxidoreductase subunit E [Parvularculaceae bacterium]
MNAESEFAEKIEALCAARSNRPEALIEILHDLQSETGAVSREAVPVIAKALNLSRADVYGVVSFYHDFRDAPAAGPVVKLCRAEACQALGCETLADALHASPPGVGGRKAVIETVYCLGNCALGPSAMVGERLIGRANADKIAHALDDETARRAGGEHG